MRLYILLSLVLVLGQLSKAQDSIYAEVDMVPLFEGCFDPLISPQQQIDCSARKIQEFVHHHLVYPDSAKKYQVEGVVVVKFIVDTTGTIEQAELVRDIGEGCGVEALRVVRLMPDFFPAQLNGQPVKTSLTLPIRFIAWDQSTSRTEAFYQLHWGTLYATEVSQMDLLGVMPVPMNVRDYYGEAYTIERLEMNYIYKKKVVTEKNRSGQLSPSMQKMVRKAKIGSAITFSAFIRTDTQEIEIFREFEVVE